MYTLTWTTYADDPDPQEREYAELWEAIECFRRVIKYPDTDSCSLFHNGKRIAHYEMLSICFA